MTTLRDYQQRTIDQLYAWFEAGSHGNPCLVLPTGSGKSHIVAALCKDALQNWPETRVLMLTHVKELIGSGMRSLKAMRWPRAMALPATSLSNFTRSVWMRSSSLQTVKYSARSMKVPAM
jgi:type I site-specific restriction endonuclease